MLYKKIKSRLSYLKNEDGIALITTLLMLGLMLVLGMSAIFSSTTDIQVSRNVKTNTEEIFVADGGLEWFKSQAFYYGNTNFYIYNPSTLTYNQPSLTASSSSSYFLDQQKWVNTSDTNWTSSAETSCGAPANRSWGWTATTPAGYYTNVTVGSLYSCIKIYAPVWEGVYYPRKDSSGKTYYPKDHRGNYKFNFDGSSITHVNSAKPNFFTVRFPDITANETSSNKSITSDIRMVFGNNLFFFQTKPYASAKACYTSGGCDAYNPDSATVNSNYKPPSNGASNNPAITTIEPIEGVVTDIYDGHVLLIFKKSGGTNYLFGIAQRYNNDITDDSTELDDTPYTFRLGKTTFGSTTRDEGTEIAGETAASTCIDKDGNDVACSLSSLTDSYGNVIAGLFEVVKVPGAELKGTGNTCFQGLYFPKNDAAGSGSYFKPWSSSEKTTSARSTTTNSYSGTFSMMVVNVDSLVDRFISKLGEINNTICQVYGKKCKWTDNTMSNVKIYNTSDCSDTPVSGLDYKAVYSQSVSSVSGQTFIINGITVTNSDFVTLK